MTDLLEQQAAIKSRRQVVRDTSGKFVRAYTAEDLQTVKKARTAALDAELIAKGLRPHKAPPGCVCVKPHFRHVGEAEAPVPTLFDRRAA